MALSTMNEPLLALEGLLAEPSAFLSEFLRGYSRLQRRLGTLLPPKSCKGLVRSMRERCQAVIDAKGMHTKL